MVQPKDEHAHLLSSLAQKIISPTVSETVSAIPSGTGCKKSVIGY